MAFNPPPQLKASLFGVRGPAASSGEKKEASKGPKPKAPAGIRLEHRVGIQAPADVIWEVIYDLAGWSDWNPLYTGAAGRIGIGQTLDLTLSLAGQPQKLQATVLEWVPNEQLHWRTSSSGGLVKAIHFVEIEALSPTGCIVSNGELVSGLMAKPSLQRTGRALHRGLREMNEALKARAEALWQARQLDPTSGT